MSDRPNIVFIMSDHHRFDYMGCAGSASIQTPNMDRLAENGTRITGMHCNVPLCVPSRIAISTGRYPARTGCYSNAHWIDPTSPTFMHALSDGGYQTGLVGKLHHFSIDVGYAARQAGLKQIGYDYARESNGKAAVRRGGFDDAYIRHLKERGIYEQAHDWQNNRGEFADAREWPFDMNDKLDYWIAGAADAYLRQVNRTRPFYLQVGFNNPHPPFDSAQEFMDMYADVEPPPPVGGVDRNPDYWQQFVACVTELDMLIGQVMKSLGKNGMLENTIVVYTSDHGDMVEDRGAKGKTLMYEGSIRVPFIASGPGIPKGRTVETLAELFDVGKTFCDFAGIGSHPYDQGKSMKPVLTGEAEVHRENVFAEMGSDKMIRDGKYKLMYGDFMRENRTDYTEDPFGEHQKRQRPVSLMPDKISLYDLENDPWEENDLSEDQAHQHVLWEMKEKLLQRMIRNSQAIV